MLPLWRQSRLADVAVHPRQNCHSGSPARMPRCSTGKLLVSSGRVGPISASPAGRKTRRPRRRDARTRTGLRGRCGAGWGTGRLRRVRRGRPDDPAVHVVGDHARSAVESAGAVPGPAFPRDHGRGPRQRPGRPAGDSRGIRRPGVRRRRDRGDGRDRGGPGRGRRPVAGRPARAAASGLVSGAGGRDGRDRHGAALAGPAGLRCAEGQLRGLGENEPALLAGRLPRLCRVLHVAGVHRAALDKAKGGRGRLRPGDHRRDAAAGGRGRERAHRGGRRGHLPAGALPGPDRARRPGRDRALPDRRGDCGLDRRADGDHPRWRARPDGM